MVSASDEYNNVESKWLGSGGDDMFARYPYGEARNFSNKIVPDEVIKIRTYNWRTYILLDAEPDWLILEGGSTGHVS